MEEKIEAPARKFNRRRWALVVIAPLILISISAVALHRSEGHYFDSEGVTLHYKDEGQGVPVVLIHGFGLNGEWNWRLPRISQRLAREFRVITLDVRGHGFSGKPHGPEAYGAELAHDVRRLLDHLEIDKAHVAGYSMGGFITLKFLSLYPERLYSAAICGAGWDEINEENLELLKTITTAIDQHQKFDPLITKLEPDGNPSFIKFAAVNVAMSMFNDTAAIVNVFKTFRELAVPEEILAQNAVAVLGIVGSDDPLREQTERLAEIAPHVQESYIPNRDHATTLISREFYRTLSAFFREHSPVAPEGLEYAPLVEASAG